MRPFLMLRMKANIHNDLKIDQLMHGLSRSDFTEELLKAWVEGTGDYAGLGSLHSRLQPLETKLGKIYFKKWFFHKLFPSLSTYESSSSLLIENNRKQFFHLVPYSYVEGLE